jgi:hypothetical protein
MSKRSDIPGRWEGDGSPCIWAGSDGRPVAYRGDAGHPLDGVAAAPGAKPRKGRG